MAEYSKIAYYYIMLAAAVADARLIYRMIHSNLGLNFRAVQNDEVAAKSVGVRVLHVRVLAFTVASAMAGFAGGLYGHYLLLITPEIPSLDLQFKVLAMTVIGGMGSLVGPVLGAFALNILERVHPRLRRIPRAGVRPGRAGRGALRAERAAGPLAQAAPSGPRPPRETVAAGGRVRDASTGS